MKHLFKALAAFQQECPVIHKGTEGYGYSYADLAAIKSVIDPLLQKHGMGYTQPINGTQICTTIFHIESGETIEGCADIPQGVSLAKMNEFQVLGSAITYMRRYQLSSMLGIVTDKDTDAGGQQTAKPKSDKIWLNPKTEAWTKAVKYLQGEGTITEIKKKYSISTANELLLMDSTLAEI